MVDFMLGVLTTYIGTHSHIHTNNNQNNKEVGGTFFSSTWVAQPPGLSSPEAPLAHGQDKILYKETFLSAHLGALSQHLSLWART